MQKKIYAVIKTILAITFIFSGFVKGVEPMGTAIKMNDYFIAFNMGNWTFLSKTLSVILPAFELLLGLLLLANIYKKTVKILVFISMIFFTGLTYFIYTDNPVSDCGCFGDAYTLSNEQTFIKNIILLVFALYICVAGASKSKRNSSYVYVDYLSNISNKQKRSNFRFLVLLTIFSFLNPIYAYVYHPVIEFLPYKIGVNINDLTEFKASDSSQEPLMLYKNKETLETQEFGLNDTEWQDTLKWEFVELIDNTKNEKIVSFDVINNFGDNIASDFLEKGDTTIFIVAKNILDIEEYAAKVKQITEVAQNNYEIVVLTTSKIREGERMLSDFGIYGVPVYNMDETMLKSFVRADVGVVVVGDAIILSKNNLKTMSTVTEMNDFYKLLSIERFKYATYITINIILLVTIFAFLVISKYKYDEH